MSYLGQTECKAADRCGLFVRNCIRQRGYPNRIAAGIATASAISSIEVGQTITDGKVTGRTCRIRFWDKNSAQERLFRHMGLFRKENAPRQALRKMEIVFVSPEGEVVPFANRRKARET